MKKQLLSLLLLLCCSISLYAHKQHMLKKITNHNIQFIRCFFTDLVAHLKEIMIPAQHIENAIDEGLYFDGSSIPGFTNIYESDMHLTLDTNTFRSVPTCDGNVGVVICDNGYGPGKPYDACPRNVLKQTMQKAAHLGYGLYVGLEIEFFLFDNNTKATCDTLGYCDREPCPLRAAQKRSLLQTLQQYGVDAVKLHHEVASGQHEIVINHHNPLVVADQIILAKHAIREWASQNNLDATFMPKPIFGQNGSGMHIHFSLCDINTGTNLFYDPYNSCGLSQTAYQFIAGVLKHIRELDAIFNSTINSFKRLVPGYEAPTYVCWANKNRSALIRIPEFDHDCGAAARAELRCPDALCNPYLAFTALLEAGLAGIQYQEIIPDAIEQNLYRLSPDEICTYGIQTLPTSLQHALDLFEASTFVQAIFSQRLRSEFLKAKNNEISLFNRIVTDWELKRYHHS